MSKKETEIEFYTCDEPDPENGNILYCDVYLHGKMVFTLVVGPEKYQDGWDMKWTGNAELCLRYADSEEFDVLDVVGGLKQGDSNKNTAIAKKLMHDRAIEIVDNAMLATDWYHNNLDELIEAARETMHEMINSAILSGAAPLEMQDPDSYVFAKAIITIWGDQRNYAPPNDEKEAFLELKTLLEEYRQEIAALQPPKSNVEGE